MISFKEYLLETPLSGKATDGRLNVQKYIVDNPNAMKIDFYFEQPKTKNKDNNVFDGSGNVSNVLQFDKDAKFKLRSKKIFEIDGLHCLDTSIGFIPAKFVKKPSGFKAMDAEIFATNELDSLIKRAVSENGENGINVKVGKFTIKDVVSASSEHIKGDPKADIALFDSKGKEVGFISHKKEGGSEGILSV